MSHLKILFGYAKRGSFIGMCGVLGFLPFQILAHGDLHEQIAATTKLIAREPGNAELYLKRGELHRAHEDWDGALADYEQAATLNPKLTLVDLARGKALLAANWPASAKFFLDRFLTAHTNHVDALVTRARVLVKLGQRVAAARDYTSAIDFSSEPKPEYYIERAQALTAEGDAHFEEALRGLNAGIKKLGPLVTLQLFAIDIEIKRARYDAALIRLDQIAAKSPRKETWLARRGEILQQAGRLSEARSAFQSALTAIASVPPARRQAPAIVELEKRLLSASKNLEQVADSQRTGAKE
jgi:predicted Zn-dependent protease